MSKTPDSFRSEVEKILNDWLAGSISMAWCREVKWLDGSSSSQEKTLQGIVL